MIYEYSCWRCKTNTDVIKPVKDYDSDEFCEECGGTMERLIRGASLQVSEFNTGFQPAFGRRFRNKNDLNNEIRKINGEDGRDIVEVGTDVMTKVTPKRDTYEF